MNDLLKLAVEAHGGLTRWNRLAAVEARLSISGALWHLKGKPEALKHVRIEAPLHRERLIIHFETENRRATFSPDRIVIETESGDFLESRENPRTAFQGHTLETPWDDFHRLYFNSYALWNYLMAPFLYTWPGFETEELAPWKENGEVWRPLKITYPDSIAGHTREQVAYYGQDGLLRRHAYTVDVLGGASGLNYAYDYRNVNGIMVPTTRRVYPSDANKQKVPEPLLVAIDIRDIAFIEAQQANRPAPPANCSHRADASRAAPDARPDHDGRVQSSNRATLEGGIGATWPVCVGA